MMKLNVKMTLNLDVEVEEDWDKSLSMDAQDIAQLLATLYVYDLQNNAKENKDDPANIRGVTINDWKFD